MLTRGDRVAFPLTCPPRKGSCHAGLSRDASACGGARGSQPAGRRLPGLGSKAGCGQPSRCLRPGQGRRTRRWSHRRADQPGALAVGKAGGLWRTADGSGAESRRPLAGGARSLGRAHGRPRGGQDRRPVPQKAGGYAGLVFTPDGQRLLASSFTGTIGVFAVDDEGELEAKKPIQLNTADGASGEAILPVGLAIDRAGKSLWAVLNLRMHWPRSTWRPAAASRDPGGQRAVWRGAGRRHGLCLELGRSKPEGACRPVLGRGARVRVDAVRTSLRRIGVSRRPGHAAEVKQIVVGLHPSAMVATPDGRVCDRRQRQQRHRFGDRHAERRSRRNDLDAAREPVRQRANALAFSPDGRRSMSPTAPTTLSP